MVLHAHLFPLTFQLEDVGLRLHQLILEETHLLGQIGKNIFQLKYFNPGSHQRSPFLSSRILHTELPNVLFERFDVGVIVEHPLHIGLLLSHQGLDLLLVINYFKLTDC
jgi:hypothetical protein